MFDRMIFYHIYPLGFCGAPLYNDGLTVPRIKKVMDWIPHMKKLGVNALYFSPLFQSDKHGYDTRDYFWLDCRLGTNDDFAEVCRALHKNAIAVVPDAVFNHVGRGFWAFRDVLEKRENSPYRDWFFIDFNGNTPCGDGFAYECWEGHFELVKLNLHNPAVVEHLFLAIDWWLKHFDIDGLRLDVAYCLPPGFLRKLRAFCDSRKRDFLLIGEIIHGDYRERVNGEMLHSCTNYECYKGLYSSFNEMNMFEIAWSFNRQTGSDGGALYPDLPFLNFADNHDVSRLASILKSERHLRAVYGILFTMSGMPCLYYGSEWGAAGAKEEGDEALRPCFDSPVFNGLSEWICRLGEIRQTYDALRRGSYTPLLVQNRQLVYLRSYGGQRLVAAVNADFSLCQVRFSVPGGVQCGTDVFTGEKVRFDGGLTLDACGFYLFLIENSQPQ